MRSHCWVVSWQWRPYADFLESVDSTVEYLYTKFVEFSFCCCLFLFECENECECVCAFSVMFFCADDVQWKRMSRA